MSAIVEVRYRYRLRVNRTQAALLQAAFDTCRFVWNQALGRWEDLWRQERISLSYRAADKEPTDWRSRFEWLAEQPSIPQQQVLRDLYRRSRRSSVGPTRPRGHAASLAEPAMPLLGGPSGGSRCPGAVLGAPGTALRSPPVRAVFHCEWCGVGRCRHRRAA